MQLYDADELIAKKREPLLDYAEHYDFTVPGAIETYDLVAQGLVLRGDIDFNKAHRMTSTRRRAWDALEHLSIAYSAGNPLDELRAFYPTVLEYWEVYAKYDRIFDDSPEANGRRVPHLDLYDFSYHQALRLICFGLLLGHSDLMPRWASILDYENEDPDILLEVLLAPFVPGRRPGVTYTRTLPYKKLQKVFDATPEKRPSLMAKYLDEWYTASRREGYHGLHEAPNFTGYWSYEAAAITWLLGIDDSSYRDMQFYPSELVDYARAQYSQDEAVAKLETGRIAANQPCPRGGWWWTPAKFASRSEFKQGDVMPDFPDSSYGATIWYWDQNQD
ncbi:PoNe immunity protein domain-containing protein [Chitinibacter sp. ZOR0017]|uniref:PoNe immunity protein domain-containing protein n=1 Tax=Chitinibacter sp. ZOR0017 TaxID=1339254 RepID=UPI00064617AD|nr:PoNe immunity protein domain-containing protein [Chitinibacter sp. ZOR0017]